LKPPIAGDGLRFRHATISSARAEAEKGTPVVGKVGIEGVSIRYPYSSPSVPTGEELVDPYHAPPESPDQFGLFLLRSEMKNPLRPLKSAVSTSLEAALTFTGARETISIH
jgi:hypothetical protein